MVTINQSFSHVIYIYIRCQVKLFQVVWKEKLFLPFIKLSEKIFFPPLLVFHFVTHSHFSLLVSKTSRKRQNVNVIIYLQFFKNAPPKKKWKKKVFQSVQCIKMSLFVGKFVSYFTVFFTY